MPEQEEPFEPLTFDQLAALDQLNREFEDSDSIVLADYDELEANTEDKPLKVLNVKLDTAVFKESVIDMYYSPKSRRVARIAGAAAAIGLSATLFFNRQSVIDTTREEVAQSAEDAAAHSFTQTVRLDAIAKSGTKLAQFSLRSGFMFSCPPIGDGLQHYFQDIASASKSSPLRHTAQTMLPIQMNAIPKHVFDKANMQELSEPYCSQPTNKSEAEQHQFALLDETFRQSMVNYDYHGIDPDFYAQGIDHDVREATVNAYTWSWEHIKQLLYQYGGASAGVITASLLFRRKINEAHFRISEIIQNSRV